MDSSYTEPRLTRSRARMLQSASNTPATAKRATTTRSTRDKNKKEDIVDVEPQQLFKDITNQQPANEVAYQQTSVQLPSAEPEEHLMATSPCSDNLETVQNNYHLKQRCPNNEAAGSLAQSGTPPREVLGVLEDNEQERASADHKSVQKGSALNTQHDTKTLEVIKTVDVLRDSSGTPGGHTVPPDTPVEQEQQQQLASLCSLPIHGSSNCEESSKAAELHADKPFEKALQQPPLCSTEVTSCLPNPELKKADELVTSPSQENRNPVTNASLLHVLPVTPRESESLGEDERRPSATMGQDIVSPVFLHSADSARKEALCATERESPRSDPRHSTSDAQCVHNHSLPPVHETDQTSHPNTDQAEAGLHSDDSLGQTLVMEEAECADTLMGDVTHETPSETNHHYQADDVLSNDQITKDGRMDSMAPFQSLPSRPRLKSKVVVSEKYEPRSLNQLRREIKAKMSKTAPVDAQPKTCSLHEVRPNRLVSEAFHDDTEEETEENCQYENAYDQDADDVLSKALGSMHIKPAKARPSPLKGVSMPLGRHTRIDDLDQFVESPTSGKPPLKGIPMATGQHIRFD